MGVGASLVAALEERVRAAGALTLYLGTDDDGRPWNERRRHRALSGCAVPCDESPGDRSPGRLLLRQGFEVVGLIPDANGPGKPDILMAKQVARVLVNQGMNRRRLHLRRPFSMPVPAPRL